MGGYDPAVDAGYPGIVFDVKRRRDTFLFADHQTEEAM